MEDRVPNGEGAAGVAPEVLKPKLLQDAGLPHVGYLVVPVGAANVHPALGRGIAAEHRAVLHDGDSGAVTGGREGGTDPSHAAADDAEVDIVVHS